MGYLVAWVERKTPDRNQTPIDTDHYKIFCDGEDYTIPSEQHAKGFYNQMCAKMMDGDTSNGIYTVQFCKIQDSTEPHHTDKPSWEKFDREDLKIIPKAIAAGWKVEFNYKDVSSNKITPENPPLFPIHFEKGTRNVWKGSVYWMTGILTRDGFIDKKPLKSLNEIFSL